MSEAPLVDLTNCDREPIHLLGKVQSFGFLLGVSREWIIVHASENSAAFIGKDATALLGQALNTVLSEEAIHTIRGRLQALSGLDGVERIFRMPLQKNGPDFDVAVYGQHGSTFVEAEPSTPRDTVEPIAAVRTMLSRLQDTASITSFFSDAARQVRALIGFDRVMVYRFGPDGSGEVVAESVRAGLVKFLGLHYPASDIPAQARRLYERNWLRIIADIGGVPVPILSDPAHGKDPVDLSMSMLRSVSPIHIEYLSNMGVGASLSISILRNGKLWGLFACHHMGPRHISYEKRSSAELFGQMFSLLLESRERQEDSQCEASARALQTEMLKDLTGREPSSEEIVRKVEAFSEVIEFDGVAMSLNGQVAANGLTPTHEEILGLFRYLPKHANGHIIATHELAKFYPAGADFQARAAGMLILPISRAPRDYIIFFRKEFSRTVTWGGDPTKPAMLGPNGVRLTPRKSFEAWQQVVSGQSKPFTERDIRIAESLRIALLEIVLRLADVAEKQRKSAQERQELLIAELNHRVRNILSLIRGLISQSGGEAKTVEDFISVVGGRIQALARAHDQITVENWGPSSLSGLLQAEVSAYLSKKAGRVEMEGPDVLLDPRAFSTLALVIHEMLTNSAKYGALCDSAGRVYVTWLIDDTGALRMEWKEEGGPPVQAPARRGFGSTIIERSIPFDLNGEADIEYRLAGVRAVFLIPATFVQSGEGQDKHIEQEPALRAPVQLSGHILIVEDNMIIAMDAEASVLRLGAKKVSIAGTVTDGLHHVAQERPDLALLDVNLGLESSFAVADRLVALGVPFVFATGYGKNAELPERFADVPVVNKPYTADVLGPKLAQALAGAGKS